jgi:hypothetical protein
MLAPVESFVAELGPVGGVVEHAPQVVIDARQLRA